MKKLVLIVCISTILLIPPAKAQENIAYSNTDNSIIAKGNYPLVKDKKLQEALDLLIDTDGEWARRAIAGINETNYPIKVVFKNLSTIGAQFKDLDALGWKDDKNKLTIFINEKHKNAPTEALSALLSHESIHQDRDNSINEETYGTTYEAEVWIQLKKKYPALKNIAPGENSLVDRENLLEMFFRQAGFNPTKIEEKVRENPSYKNLPASSPGFGK